MYLLREDLRFLRTLNEGLKLGWASHAESDTRQRMKKAGYADCLRNPRRWVITQKGRDAVAEHDS